MNSIPEVTFPLHQSCLSDIKERKSLSFSEINACHCHQPCNCLLKNETGFHDADRTYRRWCCDVSCTEHFGFVLSDSRQYCPE